MKARSFLGGHGAYFLSEKGHDGMPKDTFGHVKLTFDFRLLDNTRNQVLYSTITSSTFYTWYTTATSRDSAFYWCISFLGYSMFVIARGALFLTVIAFTSHKSVRIRRQECSRVLS